MFLAVAHALALVPSTYMPIAARHPTTRTAIARTAVHVEMQAPMSGEAAMPKIVADETYGMMLSTLLKTNNSIASEISKNYAMVDYAFLKRLDEKIAKGGEMLPKLQEIKESVNAEMASRMQTAAATLRDVLQSPTPVIMEGKIAGFARQGKIDDALLQLLEANLQQAQSAGEQGKGAVAIMTKLQERVRTEVDATVAPPMALLRQLLRMNDPIARESLLREKMAPKKKSSIVLASGQGEEVDPESTEPDVSPRLLASAISDIKQRFGNVDESYDTGFVQKIETIASEAEAVALDLAGGKELTAQQQQDMMWERGTVSVWDLEAVEEEAAQSGKMAVWEEEAQQQMARQDERQRQEGIQRDFQ